MAYLVTNIGAFQIVEAVERDTGDCSLAAFEGMWKRSPTLAFAMLIFLLSLAGIPFVVGFWAKLYVFVVAWQSGLYLLVILGAVLAVIAAASCRQSPWCLRRGSDQGKAAALADRSTLAMRYSLGS